jgi:hypothetical protein
MATNEQVFEEIDRLLDAAWFLSRRLAIDGRHRNAVSSKIDRAIIKARFERGCAEQEGTLLKESHVFDIAKRLKQAGLQD